MEFWTAAGNVDDVNSFDHFVSAAFNPEFWYPWRFAVV
jgi:hypothetical protein